MTFQFLIFFQLFQIGFQFKDLPVDDQRPDWGFYAHREINYLAVFTLPPEMLVLFKAEIDYIKEHAVDPDKRRYATKHEAVRHYIDLDQWGRDTFDHVHRDLYKSVADNLLPVIELTGSTSLDTGRVIESGDSITWHFTEEHISWSRQEYYNWVRRYIMPQYYNDVWLADPDSLDALAEIDTSTHQISLFDGFSSHGILPYNLERMQRKLTQAFVHYDKNAILRYSADLGHYIGDAHVPLHTTKNYNGQLTGQDGIHGFWESRLPEIYAEPEYDLLMDRASYIRDVRSFYWDVVLTSHSYVDSVLLIEKRLSLSYPSDKQYTYENRNGILVRTYSRNYADAFHISLGGMVEDRMRASILAVGSAWYTAWVDAGQPDLNLLGVDSIPNHAFVDTTQNLGVFHGRLHPD